jgi:hypothetical protein
LPGLRRAAANPRSLAWRGELTTIDYLTLAGELKLNADDGQFSRSSPASGNLSRS